MPFVINIFFQTSSELCILLSHEHCNADQWVCRGGGTPSPPAWIGEKIMFFISLHLGPFMNLTIILSTSFLICLLGRGKMDAKCVNLDRRQILVMLTFAEVDNFTVDHIPISDLTAFIAFLQLSSSWSRLPVI